VPYLILSDIKHLNLLVEDTNHSRRTSKIFFPKDVLLDQLEIKLATPKSPARLDYSKVNKSVSAKKHKRGLVDSS
jgi:hypothetical protein